jgi:predicted HTH transcriptional regulator
MSRRRTKDRIARRESKRVDFKERLDLSKAEDWCEIIKDIAAMANSGGGSILFGIKDDGTPSGWDPSNVLATDPAHIVDKIAKYTGEQFSDFEIVATRRENYR